MTVAFLPGAGGDPGFWRPVTERMPAEFSATRLAWPGAGDQPHDPRVRCFEDLIGFTATSLDDHGDLVAQSMGGVVAIGVALRHPRKVRRLVLVATSGGLDVQSLGAAEWREEYRAEYPDAAAWVSEERPDYGPAIAEVRVPTLLLWGDADPLSPVAVGERLRDLLPDGELHVLPGGTHALASERPDWAAPLIIDHLSRH